MYGDTNNPDRPPDNTVEMPPIPRRAALYVGMDEAGERERTLRRYADAQGLEVVAAYHDHQGSGLSRVVTDAQEDRFDAVVILDRSAVESTGVSYDWLRDALTEISVRLLVADETQI